MDEPAPIPVGKVLEYRCNGIATAEWVCTSVPTGSLRIQTMIRIDGRKKADLMNGMNNVYPHRSKRGIGYYELKAPRTLSQAEVKDLIKQHIIHDLLTF